MVNNISRFGSAQRAKTRPTKVAVFKEHSDRLVDNDMNRNDYQDENVMEYVRSEAPKVSPSLKSLKQKKTAQLTEKLEALKAQIRMREKRIVEASLESKPVTAHSPNQAPPKNSSYLNVTNVMPVNGKTSYVKGCCTLMCPEEETLRRAKENNIHLLERDFEKYPAELADLKDLSDIERTVKALTRSSAGLILNKPHLVRTESSLWESLQYLWKYILDICRLNVDERFTPVFVFGFINDRTRSIRKDFSLQGYLSDTGPLSKVCILVFEEICRFHLLADYLLCENEKSEGHDEVLNLQETNKCLKAIIEFYDRVRLDNLDPDLLKNESEFRSYFLLLQLQSIQGSYLQVTSILRLWIGNTMGLPAKGIVLAHKIIESYHKRDFHSLLRIYSHEQTSVFFSILIHPLLTKVWKFSLEILTTTSKRGQVFSLNIILQMFDIKCLKDLDCVASSIGYSTTYNDDTSQISFQYNAVETDVEPYRCLSNVIDKKLKEYPKMFSLVKGVVSHTNNVKVDSHHKVKTLKPVFQIKTQKYEAKQIPKKIPPAKQPSFKVSVAKPVPTMFSKLPVVVPSPTRTAPVLKLTKRKRELDSKVQEKKFFIAPSRFSQNRFHRTPNTIENKWNFIDLAFSRLLQKRYIRKLQNYAEASSLNSCIYRACSHFSKSRVWFGSKNEDSLKVFCFFNSGKKLNPITRSYGHKSMSICFSSKEELSLLLAFIKSREDMEMIFELLNLSNKIGYKRRIPQVAYFIFSNKCNIDDYMNMLERSSIGSWKISVMDHEDLNQVESSIYQGLRYVCYQPRPRVPLITPVELIDLVINSCISVVVPKIEVRPFILATSVFQDYCFRRNEALDELIKYFCMKDIICALEHFRIPELVINKEGTINTVLNCVIKTFNIKVSAEELNGDILKWNLKKSLNFYSFVYEMFDTECRVQSASSTSVCFPFSNLQRVCEKVKNSELCNTNGERVLKIIKDMSSLLKN